MFSIPLCHCYQCKHVSWCSKRGHGIH